MDAELVILVLQQHKESRSLPRQIRADNGSELISSWKDPIIGRQQFQTQGFAADHKSPGDQ